ncbi:hypothetical protein [Brachybacterium vulturis]|uniref:hypothetical protein n=1 Tax=Brachybacterium vulturis TaxID=2017484 RepID=UPI0012FE5734|nr:hypothetical protein [Brachybacterium vulturis]
MTESPSSAEQQGPTEEQRHGRQTSSIQTTAIEDLHETVQVHSGQTVHFAIESYSDTMEYANPALLQVIASDESGKRIPIPGWPRVSARVDEYIYLPPSDPSDPMLTRFSVEVPEGTATVELVGHQWRARAQTTIVGKLEIFGGRSEVPPFRTELGTRLEWPVELYNELVDVPSGVDSLEIDILVAGTKTEAKSPLVFEFYGNHHEVLLPPAELPQSPRLGAYLYLVAPPAAQERNKLKVSIPDGVAKIRVHGVKWAKNQANIAEKPQFQFESSSGREAVLECLLNGFEDSDLVVIDTTAPPLGHETLSLRPNNLSIEYNRAGSSVLFVPFGELKGFPPIVKPGLAQVGRQSVSSLVEELVERRAGKSNIYICSSFPSLECVTRAEYLRRQGWRVVYEVRDDMEEFNRVGYSKWYHPLLERKMLSIADVRVTVSDALTRKMRAMSREDSTVSTVPNGVAAMTLRMSTSLRSEAQLEHRNASNIIGYVGHLTPSWFDWELLIAAARRLPQFNFEIIGHGKPSHLELPFNARFLGSMSHDELLPHAATWRTGIIPFISSPLTRGVDPNKIYEYFAWGMRVVTAPMGSVQHYPSTWVYSSAEEFIKSIQESMATPMDSSELARIADFAEHSSWRNRADKMMELIKEGAS